ncbi:MAG: potassium channel protein [Gammaproteobacteria bacterium]|nr:MAG: potassium channel protein [Gammaproteobacteria bacterium]
MSIVTSLILRQMRAPFITLILGYSIAILGMVLTPGVDDQGNVWHMSIFEAFYFVSYTATTIGFGEIPYPLTNAQRLWALVTIYLTVTSWFYALGKTITLIQDPMFRDALKKSRFAHDIKKLHTNFILICGYGETGTALAHALTERHIQPVVVEQDPEKIKALPLADFPIFVPGIQGDARDPETLRLAGLQHKKCAAVIAVTASDATNLKIAITAKLLNSKLCVASRAEHREFEENMYSFGTDYVINPYETFANIFGMALHSPSLHLIYDWLTGVPNTRLSNPLYVQEGHWIICGYGRFGQELHKQLAKHNIPVTAIDPSLERREDFINQFDTQKNDFIIGTGFDAHTLTLAGVEKATGLISGTDNDSNNLSIIMTAREINPDLFIVARQNKQSNERLFKATRANITMQPSEIIARKIRTLLTAPLMIAFLNKAQTQDPEWANIAVSRLSGIVGDNRPNIWTVNITDTEARALHKVLTFGRMIRVGNLSQDPRLRDKKLPCVALMLKRSNKLLLMPTDDIALKPGDQLLYCGTPVAERSIKWTINDVHSLNYIMTYEASPDSFIWRKIYMFMKRKERRARARTLSSENNEQDN